MSIEVVLQQMIIIFLLILAGVFFFRKKMLSNDTAKQLSAIIINLCNPALLLCSVFDDSPKVSGGELALGFLIVLISYLILLVCSQIFPYLLRIQKPDHFSYRMLTIYGNVGFIGIPLALAVLGPGSLIYVSLCNLVYNLLIYTHGIATLKNAARLQETAGRPMTGDEKKKGAGVPIGRRAHLLSITKNFVNAGTVSAVLTIVLYLCDVRLPSLIPDTLTQIGRSTTFLSMLVLGVSVAQMSLREIFSQGKLYVFVILRMLLIPIGCIFLFRFITDNTLIVNTLTLLLAVPCGNIPLILSKQYELDGTTLSRGIILSTLLALLTIPVVTLFV